MNGSKSSRLSALPRQHTAGTAPRFEWVISRFRWLQRHAVSWKSALQRFVELFKIRPPDTAQVLLRIQRMERDIVLPAKVAAIGILIYQFYFTHWVVSRTMILEVPLEYAHYYLWFWIVA